MICHATSILYEASTDSMYLALHEGYVTHTVAHDDRDFAVNIGEDGEPVGYDIQFAANIRMSLLTRFTCCDAMRGKQAIPHSTKTNKASAGDWAKKCPEACWPRGGWFFAHVKEGGGLPQPPAGNMGS